MKIANLTTFRSPQRQTLKLEVEFVLDDGRQPEDLMRRIASHSDVNSVTLDA